ncbi:hypothetical protein PJE062_4024 [Pseudovibrio sp. JE062]|nr:hypothetical protein PJE062_4024 [Pseudovibrio sp. JE062]
MTARVKELTERASLGQKARPYAPSTNIYRRNHKTYAREDQHHTTTGIARPDANTAAQTNDLSFHQTLKLTPPQAPTSRQSQTAAHFQLPVHQHQSLKENITGIDHDQNTLHALAMQTADGQVRDL